MTAAPVDNLVVRGFVFYLVPYCLEDNHMGIISFPGLVGESGTMIVDGHTKR